MSLSHPTGGDSTASSSARAERVDFELSQLEHRLLHEGEPAEMPIAIEYHRSARAAGRYRRAQACLKQVCGCNPKNRRLRFLLIDILLHSGENAAAMSEIETAMVEFGVDDGFLGAALSVRAKLGLYATGRRPSVSLCMIVRDETEHLAACLCSIKPAVDEIVVVDTGSTDASKEIARAFGARVIEHPWGDNFSEVRNRSLAGATGDLILVLDADEVISPRDHDRLRALASAGAASRQAYTIRTRNYCDQFNTVGFRPNRGEYTEEKGAGWFPSDKVRLFPNDHRIRFRYPVHEMVEPALSELGIRTSRCDIPVHHYGKLGCERTAVKTRLYRSIGHRKLSAAPEDPAALRESAIQAGQLGSHADALALWQRFICLQGDQAEAFVNMAGAYYNLRRYPEAAASAERAMALDPSFKEARFNAALALLMLGRADLAISLLQPLVDDGSDYPAARFLLAACQACAGADSLFADGLRALSSGATADCLPNSVADTAERLLSGGQRAYASALLRSALRHNCTSPVIVALLDHCRAAA